MKSMYSISRHIFSAYSTLCLRSIRNETQKTVALYNITRNYCKQENIPNTDPSFSTFEKQQDSHASENIQNGNSDFKKKEHSEHDQESILKNNILNASLPFVVTCGWSAEAISKGAETLGYSMMVHGMFENGPTDFINYFYKNCNSKLEEKLQELIKEQQLTEEKMSTSKFIKNAVELRLRMNIDYIDSWPQALALHMSPRNALNALDNVGNLIDTIWFHAGDRSFDFDWYTKRLILAGVYKSTEMCMIQDKSDDFQETWSFLDRRMNDVTTSAKRIDQVSKATKDITSLGRAGFITALNILGLNSKSR